jgi:PAS domain S-box-containing protein
MKKSISRAWIIFTILLISFWYIFARLIEGSYILYTMKNYVVSKNFVLITILGIISILILIIFLLLQTNIKYKRSKLALSQSDTLLRTVINSLPDIICFKDSDGRWIEANTSMLELYNSSIPILGKTDAELRSLLPNFEEEFIACEETDKMVWQKGQLTMVEESFRQPDGSVRVFDVAKVPLFNEDGSKKGLVVLGREITERKKAEALKKEAEATNKLLLEMKQYEKIRTEFFSNISHELRTPLNLILGPVQLIQYMGKDVFTTSGYDRLQKYMNIVKQNSYRLIRIVNNLIDISKIDSGYLDLQLQTGNIVEAIENITLSLTDYLEAKGLNIIFDTDIEEKFITFDLDKIERIMLNLLSNAVKFSKESGTIEVTITDKTDKIQVSVKDTGIGIPKEKHSAIFERFIQVDKSFSRNREGSGIGLSLVKAFVEMHGGTISLNSNYTAGSEFIFELPVVSLPDAKVSTIKPFIYEKDSKIDIINIEFSDIYS